MIDLVEFLEARQAERLEEADDIHHHGCGSRDGDCNCGQPEWVRADVEAKRWLLRRHNKRRSTAWDRPGHVGWECAQCTNEYPCPTLAILVIPYADHPDYRKEWRPRG